MFYFLLNYLPIFIIPNEGSLRLVKGLIIIDN